MRIMLNIVAWKKKLRCYYAEQARKMRENKASVVNYSSGKGYVWPVAVHAPYNLSLRRCPGANYTHGGIDIATPGVYGKPVLASDSGIVMLVSLDVLMTMANKKLRLRWRLWQLYYD